MATAARHQRPQVSARADATTDPNEPGPWKARLSLGPEQHPRLCAESLRLKGSLVDILWTEKAKK